MNYVEFHLNDWASATVGLGFAERGLYLTMLQVYYRDEMPLPARDIERTLGVRTPDERDALDYLLRTYFDLRDGFYHNSRCDEEIAKYHGRSEGAKKAANARWGKRQGQSVSNAEPMPAPCAEDAEEMPEQCANDATASVPHYERNAEQMREPCGTDASHLSISPSNQTTTTPRGRTGANEEDPPWWETEDDPLVRKVASSVAGLPPRNGSGDDLTPSEEYVRRFVERSRVAAAKLGEDADQAIGAVLDKFVETNSGKKLGHNTKPWLVTLWSWIEAESSRWSSPPAEIVQMPRRKKRTPGVSYDELRHAVGLPTQQVAQ